MSRDETNFFLLIAVDYDLILFMKLSVVIPSFKSADMPRILAALRDLKCDEILVVDSSPRLSSFNTNDSRIRFIVSAEQLYPGAARNRGAELCNGNWVLFVDSDVELTGEAIQYLNSLDESKLNQETLYWGLYVANVGLSVWSRLQNRILNYRFHELFRRAKKGWHGQSSHFLVNKSWFWKIGGFNPYVRMREDTELAQRSTLFGGRHVVVDVFRGLHLKEFSLVGLFRDYFSRTEHSLYTQWSYPSAFTDLDPFVSLPLKILWFSPVLLFVFLLLNYSVLIVISVVLLWTLICFCCVKFIRLDLSVKEFVALLIAAPAMGIGLCFGVLSAAQRQFIQCLDYYGSSFFHSMSLIGKSVFKYGSPVHLTHFVTNKCNLRCHHCFYKETLDSKPEQMDLVKAEELYSSVGSLLWLAVAGGEPFLRRDLVELLSCAIQASAPKFLTIPTNGFYTDRIFLDMLRLAQKYPKQKIALQFSIDGDQAIHDQIRGPGSWRHLEESIARMKTLRKAYPQINLSIITVLNQENENLFPHLIDHLAKHFGLDQIHVNLFRYGSLSAPPLPASLVEKYRTTIDHNFLRADQSLGRGYNAIIFKLVTHIAKKQKEMIYQTARHGKFSVPCEAGTLSYTVWENGKVGPCEILNEQIRFDRFKDFWKSPVLKVLRGKIKSEKCRCTYECAMTVNALLGRPNYGE